MKKIYSLLAMVIMMAMVATTVNSCVFTNDEDYEEAVYIDGVWKGYVNGNYYYDRFGYVDDEWQTEIQFYQSDLYGGTGREYDFNPYTYQYYYSTFEWYIERGYIYIHYYEDNYDIVIADYRLNNGYFSGIFEDYYTGEYVAKFNLVKTTWYDYNEYGGYYWAKPLKGSSFDDEE